VRHCTDGGKERTRDLAGGNGGSRVYRSEAVYRCQARAGMAKVAPSRSAVSRTMTTAASLAVSTQFPPSPVE
jgi:hypothetical protein